MRRDEWRGETAEERAEYERWVNRKVKREPHTFVKRRGLAWLMCSRCGLLTLKNDATRRAVKAGCEKE